MRIHPFLTALLGVVLLACSDDSADQGDGGSGPVSDSGYVETGDLPAIRDRGQLRILVQQTADNYLPRDGYPLDMERRMAETFAREQGLEPVIVAVERYGDLIPALLEGRGDVIAANMTATEARREAVRFTTGLGTTRELIVGRRDGPQAETIEDLDGHRVGVMRDTTFEEVARETLAERAGVELVSLPSTMTSDAVLDELVAGEFDFAIQDSNVMNVVTEYRDDLAVRFPLGEERSLAWAVRPDAGQLHRALNDFITRERLTRSEIAPHTDDLEGIRDRRVLRVITRNNAATYYLYRGELVGFEYELAQRFADELGVRLQMVVADDHEDMIPMLKEGKGDMIAAFMTRTPEREARGVTFSRPYHHAVETVVGGADEAEMDSPEDLAGRTLHLRRGSSYWQTAEALQSQGIDVELEPLPADRETETIIAGVARGEYELTIADSHILQTEMMALGDVRGLLELGEPVDHGWVVREENPVLLEAINNFWNSEYRGLHYNIFYRRYFEDDSRIQTHRAGRVDRTDGGSLSPWDDLVREYAERHGFDWRLIVSQMYQESRFDPAAESWVGAQGLMQVMPRTAQELGLTPMDDPETGLAAGVRYMDWLRDRFPDRLPVDQRTWFSLAAYNAGVGHVRDARRLAEQQGMDPDQWFGHVEEAMLMLSEPRYHRHARHGYVRGREPYQYVRHIRDRYRAYVSLVEEQAD